MRACEGRALIMIIFAVLVSFFSTSDATGVGGYPSAVSFDPSFLIGVATAPAHAEDEATDAWIRFCEEGYCHAWMDEPRRTERLRFWTEPEVELDLAAGLGSSIYRMGIDWARLSPAAPNVTGGIPVGVQ
eukprot:6097468-Pleurochrysis_carterae.AAC.1